NIGKNLYYFTQAHFLTILAGAIGLAVLNLVPQVSHIFFQMPCPWPAVTPVKELALTIGLYVFVLFLLTFYAHAVVVILPGPQDDPGKGSAPKAWWVRSARMLWHADPLVALTQGRWASRCRRVGYLLVGGVLVLIVLNLVSHQKIWTDKKDGIGEVAFGATYGFLLLATGLWLILVPWWNLPQPPGEPLCVCTRGGRMFGRALFILLLANLLGELWWYCAKENWVLSYRNYSIWAVTHLLFCMVMVARLSDALAKFTHLPIRILTLTLAVLALALLRPEPVGKPGLAVLPLAFTIAEEKALGNDRLTDLWLKHLEMRLDELDQPPFVGPAVFVAASGGGSRAALFTALVYEELSKRGIDWSGGHEAESRTYAGLRRTVADNIVLISSV